METKKKSFRDIIKVIKLDSEGLPIFFGGICKAKDFRQT